MHCDAGYMVGGQSGELYVAIDRIIYVRENTARNNRAVIGCIAVPERYVTGELDGKTKPSPADSDHVWPPDKEKRLRTSYSLVAYHVMETPDAVMELINAERELIRMIESK